MIKEVEVGEVFEFIRNGASIKQDENAGGLPITRIETIWNSKVDTNRFGYANIEDDNMFAKYLLEKGDILMSHINSPKHLGKCAVYTGKPNRLIHGMNLLNLRPKKERTFPKYIYYYLNSIYFKPLVMKISNQSVNQASFSAGNLKKLRIPLPPLDEQKKIAAILDAADTLRQKNQQLIAKYNALSQSLFLDMFGDIKGEMVSLSSLCEVNPKKSEIAAMSKSKWVSFIPMTNVSEEGEVDLSEERLLIDVWSGFTYFADDDVVFAK